jgi:general secretion pathway protein D
MFRIFSLAILVSFLSACASPKRIDVELSRANVPLAESLSLGDQIPVAVDAPASAPDAVDPQRERTVFERLEGTVREAPPVNQRGPGSKLPTNNSLTVSSDQMPLRSLITYVFNDLIQANFVIADASASLEQPVTLSIDKPVSSRQLFKLLADLLRSRGLKISESDGVFFIGPESGKTGGDIPIGYGTRPADVPESTGKILQAVFLKYASIVTIEKIVVDFLDVQIWRDPSSNGIFFTGTRDVILKVLDIVRLIDQPAIRSSRVGIVNLSYISSRELTDQLTTLLENEGIPTGLGRAEGKSVALVPLDQIGAVVVFALGAQLLDRVEFWVKQIDRPGKGSTERYFVYQPRYSRAIELGESLAALIGAQPPASGSAGNQSRDTRSAINGTQGTFAGVSSQNVLRRDSGAMAGAPSSNSLSIKGDGVTLSVDARSNSLVFYTTGPRYESLLPLVRRLDIPPRQIQLEATIAEVSLTGEFANGVEFAFKQFRDPNPLSDEGAQLKFSGGTAGRLGLTSGGFALDFISSVTDQVRLRLSASDGQVNILSRPRLMVRDGSPAIISVGNDVPTVGATASDPIESNRQVTTVLYRKTGLTLSVTPTVNAQGLVVMKVDQSISNSVPGASGVQGAPVFFERSVSSEIVANSGQTVMLAGLISDSSTESSSGVPGLYRIPLLGGLFSSQGKKREKTELVLLITPRVIDSPSQADSVLDAIRSSLNFIDLGSQEIKNQAQK